MLLMKNKSFKIQLSSIIVLGTMMFSAFAQKQNQITPGEIWPDSEGRHIQAHGGGIIKSGGIFYWYGEQREQGLDTNYRYVSCYSSKNLVHWKFKGNVLVLAKPDSILNDRWVLERPKVFQNLKTGKYVMYMHIDGSIKNKSKYRWSYDYARVGVAISDKPTGPFKFVRTFRPLDQESRDIGQFVDDNGDAYLIFESRPKKGFYIASLSDDYLDVEKAVSFIESPLEGGAIVYWNGLYYVIGSKLTGWTPNANKVSTSISLAGPWSDFVDIAPPELRTYDSQSTMLIKIPGTRDTTIIFMADRWNPRHQWDSRYLWMPAQIGDGKLWIPQPKPWKINIKTGEWKYVFDKHEFLKINYESSK